MDFTWCPGCGNYLILAALKTVMKNLRLEPDKTVVCGDIGCGAKMPYHLESRFFIGLHGRVVPLAVGIKLVRSDWTVIAIGGDGGIYGEGINHLIHTARRDIPIKVLVSNNEIYALTTGQASATSNLGLKTKSTPAGVVVAPLDPIKLVQASGARFARAVLATDRESLISTLTEALRFPGFAFVDIRSRGVTFNNAEN